MAGIEVTDRAHSEVGPSSLERALNCTASVGATRGLPDVPSSYAIEGTAAHTVSEWVRERNIPAATLKGITIRVVHGSGGTDVVVDQPMVDSVQEFVDRVREQHGTELVEARIRYEEYAPGGFGTLDAAILRTGVAYLTEFKHGQGVKKDARNNPQLLAQALGVLLEFDWLYQFERFLLAVSQPRLGHYDVVEYSKEDVLAWANDILRPGIAEIYGPSPKFKAGDWCQFCKIAGTCRVRMEHTFRILDGEFTDLDAAVKQERPAARAATLTGDDIAKILRAAPGIKKYLSAIEAHARAEVAAGRDVGGFKFVDGRGSYVYAVSDDLAAAELIKHGAKPEDIWERTLISTAAAKTLLGKALFAEERVLKTKTVPAGSLSNLIRKIDGSPALVPPEDPRPAKVLKPEDEFTNLEETQGGDAG